MEVPVIGKIWHSREGAAQTMKLSCLVSVSSKGLKMAGTAGAESIYCRSVAVSSVCKIVALSHRIQDTWQECFSSDRKILLG